jgi:hypothetical protein
VEPATLSNDGAATPRRSRFPRRAALRAAMIALAALVALPLFHAYRQPGFLIDFVNLRLC